MSEHWIHTSQKTYHTCCDAQSRMVALGQVSCPVSISRPMLHTRLQPHVILTRRSDGRLLMTFQKAMIFRKSESIGQKSTSTLFKASLCHWPRTVTSISGLGIWIAVRNRWRKGTRHCWDICDDSQLENLQDSHCATLSLWGRPASNCLSHRKLLLDIAPHFLVVCAVVKSLSWLRFGCPLIPTLTVNKFAFSRQ
jgi:hypothetical protein